MADALIKAPGHIMPLSFLQRLVIYFINYNLEEKQIPDALEQFLFLYLVAR